VAGLLLVLSLFFDVKNYDVALLRKKAAFIFGFGILLWAIQKSMSDYVEYKEEVKHTPTNMSKLYSDFLIWRNILFYIYVIVTILIVLS